MVQEAWVELASLMRKINETSISQSRPWASVMIEKVLLMKSDIMAMNWSKEKVYDDMGYTSDEGQSCRTHT